jgi:hypothetical protein
LTRAWFLMFLARLANLSVDKDSGKDSRAGEIMAIIVVLQLPPRLYVVKYVVKHWVKVWSKVLAHSHQHRSEVVPQTACSKVRGKEANIVYRLLASV